MINLSKSGSTVTFTFDENSGYLQNGTIDVPVNSLALITDESDMATFRKAASNDIFISARYAEFGMSKAELEAWYKENMVGSTGGGGGVTSGEVQTMIDESISGKADTSAVTVEISEAVSGKQDTLTAGRAIDISSNTISFDLPISAGTGTNSIAEGYRTVASGNYGSHAEGEETNALGNGSHAEGWASRATSNYAHAEGTKTSATTNSSHAEGYMTKTSGNYAHAEGDNTTASGADSHAEGKSTVAAGYASHAEGGSTQTKNLNEHASGRFNVSLSGSSTFGDSGNTLFSVGNGTAENARHNALEVRQNGDIYCNNGTSDVKLQDYIQYKLVQITQSAYDDLVTGGTVDNSTIYYIVN